MSDNNERKEKGAHLKLSNFSHFDVESFYFLTYSNFFFSIFRWHSLQTTDVVHRKCTQVYRLNQTNGVINDKKKNHFRLKKNQPKWTPNPNQRSEMLQSINNKNKANKIHFFCIFSSASNAFFNSILDLPLYSFIDTTVYFIPVRLADVCRRAASSEILLLQTILRNQSVFQVLHFEHGTKHKKKRF